MVDTETLMRLIDECREEEDRLQVISGEEEPSVQEQIEKQRRDTRKQLSRFEELTNALVSASSMEEQAKKLESETFELTQ